MTVGDRVAPVFGLETCTLPLCGLRLASSLHGSLTALDGSLAAWEAMTRLTDNVSPSPGEAARTSCVCVRFHRRASFANMPLSCKTASEH